MNYKPDSIYSDKYDIAYNPLDNNKYSLLTHEGNETFRLTGFMIAFSRSRSPFLMNVYLPTGLLTFISFIAFLIPVNKVPGRMALLVTIFLMLVNISAQEHSIQPMVIKRKEIVGKHRKENHKYLFRPRA